MDSTQFRTDFPEFSDTTKYPDGTINFYIDLGELMLPADVWGDALDYGLELFTAHHLAIAARDIATAGAGGTPGTVTGALTSKAVDKVSASYDASQVQLDDGGFWNMSSYGIRLLQLARMFGAGGRQL